jgi:hypothetical protein
MLATTPSSNAIAGSTVRRRRIRPARRPATLLAVASEWRPLLPAEMRSMAICPVPFPFLPNSPRLLTLRSLMPARLAGRPVRSIPDTGHKTDLPCQRPRCEHDISRRCERKCRAAERRGTPSKNGRRCQESRVSEDFRPRRR